MRHLTCISWMLATLLFLRTETASSQYAWQKYSTNPVFSGGGTATVPWVIFNSDSGRYEMWYSSYPASAGIGFAVSTDGISWTNSAFPILAPTAHTWDSLGAFCGCVIRDNGTYKMWYTGVNGPAPGGIGVGATQIGYATSSDGRHWVKYAGNPVLTAGPKSWDAGSVAYCSVIKVAAGYEMYHTGSSTSGLAVICRATSADGILWQKDTVNNPVLNGGPPGAWDGQLFLPSVVATPEKYLMWYTAEITPGGGKEGIGLATSTDAGKTWTKFGTTPVLPRGSSGAWDADWVELGSVVLKDNMFRMWYYGGGSGSRIGYASSNRQGILHQVPGDYPTIQAAIDASSKGDTVLVNENRYYENIRFNGKAIIVASRYLLDGDTAHISKTIIDGSKPVNADSASVVSFISGEDTNSVLCGFTITGGRGTILLRFPSLEGGGVLCYESGARLTRNIITGNTLSDNLDRYGVFGVGVSADGSGSQVLLMEGNTVTGNSGTAVTHAVSGGGIGLSIMKGILRQNVITDNSLVTQTTSFWAAGGGVYGEQGTLIADGNVIARNKALCPNITGGYMASGGGVFVEAMDLDFRNNRVIGNVAQSSSSKPAVGGGLLMFADNLSELRNCSVTGNYFAFNQALGSTATSGGGIDVYNERPLIENNIIVKNSAPQGGGVGIHQYILTPGPPVLINNTIAFNRATSGFGGGIYSQASPSPVVINTIAWGDTGTQEIALSGGTGIWVRNCDIQGGWPSDPSGINADPVFVTGDTMYNLMPVSRCIGRGIDSVQIGSVWYHAPTVDFDGHPRHRPLGPQPSDIGAQEEQITTDVEHGRVGIPTHFALEQNYPNPFNPKTGVRYQVPGVSEVKLVVYDVLGREVAVLVNEKKSPGTYEAHFDGSGLASGVYIYRMTAGTFTQTRKMVLLK
jgi:hypothetical protein